MLSVQENSLAPLDLNILDELLRDKRSPSTRRTYAKGLKDFFMTMTQFEPTPEAVAWFLSLERFSAIALVLRYRATLLGDHVVNGQKTTLSLKDLVGLSFRHFITNA